MILNFAQAQVASVLTEDFASYLLMILLVNKWRCHLISLPQGAILVIWSVGSRTQLNSYRTISVTFLQQWLQYEQTITTLASSSQPFCLCEGGAERLIVDVASQLAAHGYDVHVFTSHHDKNRCFEETVSGKPLHFTHFADTLFV